jgi:hypothetical protein
MPDRLGPADDTAQDVIDAMRVVLMAQDDPTKAMPVVQCLVDLAPETDGSRGIELVLQLISEAALKVEMT